MNEEQLRKFFRFIYVGQISIWNEIGQFWLENPIGTIQMGDFPANGYNMHLIRFIVQLICCGTWLVYNSIHTSKSIFFVLNVVSAHINVRIEWRMKAKGIRADKSNRNGK